MGALSRAVWTCLVAGASTLAGAGVATAGDIHIDCSAESAGDGSLSQPLNSLGSGFSLVPGDRLLLRRGTTCTGGLRVSGGGSAGAPAEVASYGSGDLPKVVGAGQDAMRIDDASNLLVHDLDILNPGGGEGLGEGAEVRNGVRVTATSQVVRNLTLSDLVVHDVAGDLTKNPEGSAGIQVSAAGPPPVRFDGLTIKDNRITSVSRSGISISGTNEPDRPDADQPWPEASTAVVVESNRIDQVAGDGIVPRGTDGAIVRGNVVSHGNLAGRPLLDPAGPMCNAGIWAFRANNTLIQGNEVFGMEHNGCDGTGFDVDYRQDGTIIEGNYSHGNGGGFVLLCTDSATHRADVRFNLSVDDGTMINHGPCGIADGVLGDLSGIRMFNNTVVGDSPTTSIQLAITKPMYQPGSFEFRNNLVYARQPVAAVACGSFCSHNAFFGLPPSGEDAVTGDPLLDEDFKLGPKSPLRGAGTPIPDGAEHDYFGNPVPAIPSIGFDQTPAPLSPKPGKACLKARAAKKKAVARVKSLGKKLKKLRRRRAPRTRIKPAVRRRNQARAEVKRRTRIVRKKCA